MFLLSFFCEMPMFDFVHHWLKGKDLLETLYTIANNFPKIMSAATTLTLIEEGIVARATPTMRRIYGFDSQPQPPDQPTR